MKMNLSRVIGKRFCLVAANVFLLCLPVHGLAATCEAVFTNGVQSNTSGGVVNFGDRVQVDGGSSQISTSNVNASGSAQCGGDDCLATGTPAANRNLAFVTGDGSDGAVWMDSNGNNNLDEGAYTTVGVGNDDRLTFNSGNATYTMSSLYAGDRAEIHVRSGDYWIDGDFTMSNDTMLDHHGGGGGSVRIFVNGDVYLGDRFETVEFRPEELLIYATGNITLGNGVSASGYFYASGSISTGNMLFEGGLSGSSVTIANGATVQYDESALDDAEFEPFCGVSVPPPVDPPGTCTDGTVEYQAEDAVINAGSVDTAHSGYSGSGFVDYENHDGSYIEWTVNQPIAGDALVTFRYANGTSGNRPMAISVNGVEVESALDFPGTGDWTDWGTQSITLNLVAGDNTIRAAATVDAGGPNVDRLDVATTCPVEPPSACPGGAALSSGLLGSYYDYSTESFPSPPAPTGTPTATRTDATVDFEWGNGSPGVAGIEDNRFAVRWNGLLRAEETGNYSFQTRTDDGVRLWVNDVLMIDSWTEEWPLTNKNSGTVALTAGETYSIRMEYYENAGGALAHLRWDLPGGDVNYVAIPEGDLISYSAGLYHCPAPPPEPPDAWADFLMDETSWTGNGSVLDSSGNDRHANPINGITTDGGAPAIPGDPGTCRYGEFNGVDQYVEVDGLSDVLNSSASLAFWIKTTQVGRDRAWEAPGVTGVEEVSEQDDIFWGWLDTGGRIGISVGDDFTSKSNTSINNGNWHHVVLTRDHLTGEYRIYINGSLDASGTIASGVIGNPFSSIGRVEDQGGSHEYFDGQLDELRIYDNVVDEDEVSAIYAATHPCSAFPDHYTIDVPETGVTCEAAPVTITARDAAGSELVPPAGFQITLSSDPATGNWVGGNTPSFDGLQPDLTVPLQQVTPGTLTLHATDGAASELVAPTIVFAEAGLLFYGDAAATISIPNQVASQVDPNIIVRAVRTNNKTMACEAAVQGLQTVDFAYECINPVSCMGSALTLAGELVGANDAGDMPLDFQGVDVAFDTAGVGSIPLNFADVGELRLYAQLLVPPVNDDPEIFLEGASNDFVVRPHTLFINAINRNTGGSNPGTTSSGTGFVAAGETFEVQVEARGVTGARTPNFGNEQTPETIDLELLSLAYPSGGNLGSLGQGAGFSPTVTAGRFSNTEVSWNEVGSITILPRLSGNDYLGAGDITHSPSVTVGRFYPNDFVLDSGSANHVCSMFGYMDESSIEIEFTVNARNLSGGPVTNYDNVSLDYVMVTDAAYAAENADNGQPLDARIAAAAEDFNWENGQLTFATVARFERDGPPDGPFTQVKLGLKLTDGVDNRPLVDLDMQSDGTGDCTVADGCNSAELGGELELRYGRLVLNNAFGPETASLPVKFHTEYWDGNFWKINLDDDCTAINLAAITYPSGTIDNADNRTVSLNGGVTEGMYGDTSSGNVNFQNGDARHFFTAPDPGIGSFSIDVSLVNYPWLRFDWNNDTNFDNDTSLPTANFSFGTYRGHDRIIYWREVLE